ILAAVFSPHLIHRTRADERSALLRPSDNLTSRPALQKRTNPPLTSPFSRPLQPASSIACFLRASGTGPFVPNLSPFPSRVPRAALLQLDPHTELSPARAQTRSFSGALLHPILLYNPASQPAPAPCTTWPLNPPCLPTPTLSPSTSTTKTTSSTSSTSTSSTNTSTCPTPCSPRPPPQFPSTPPSPSTPRRSTPSTT
ncbi:hypothetical protein HETIRDRAFT_457688, partial [Heterobasidion irregulare TC 32-1]